MQRTIKFVSSWKEKKKDHDNCYYYHTKENCSEVITMEYMEFMEWHARDENIYLPRMLPFFSVTFFLFGMY